MDDNLRRLLWKDLKTAWCKSSHCFELGCGQETLAYWVCDATGRLHSPKDLRRVLMHHAVRGDVRVERRDGKTTRFFLPHAPKGKPRPPKPPRARIVSVRGVPTSPISPSGAE